MKQRNPKTLGESVRKRNTITGRIIRQQMGARNCAEAVGSILPGCEIFGLSKGNWSLIDLIEICLKASGPADVVLSTWTASVADITFANRLLVNGSIRSFRLVADLAFQQIAPAYCAAARQAFGDGAIRLTKNHSKFVTIRNAKWNLAIRTSMNLTENKRVEWFEVSDSEPMAAFLEAAVDCLFREQTDVENASMCTKEHTKKFKDSFGIFSKRTAAAVDDRQFFGDGAFDVDLRRVGVTYE